MYSTPIPLLPLKNVVIFPRNVVTMLVGRARSIQAVEEALTRDRRIIVTTHRDAEIDDPRPDDLHRIGTLVEIISVERQQGSNIQVILEGLARVSILSFTIPAPSTGLKPSRPLKRSSVRAKAPYSQASSTI